MLTHDNMLRNAWAAGTRVGVRAEDRYFNCRPFFHVGGSTLSALMSLVSGCCLVTLPTFEAGAALEMLERERCTLISGNDTIFQMLMGHADFARRKLHLRGGWAAAGPQTMRAIIDRLGMKTVCAAYGLSEASPNVVMSDWRDAEELRVEGLALPLPGIELRISAEKEIQVRGWSVMRGYCNNPGGDREGVHRRRLAAHGRSRRTDRRRAPAHGRPPEGRVPRRRRERRAGGGGGGAARASRRWRPRRWSACRTRGWERCLAPT